MQPAHTLNLQIENDVKANKRLQLVDDLLCYSTFASVATRLFTYKIIDGRPHEASTVIPRDQIASVSVNRHTSDRPNTGKINTQTICKS